MSESRASSKDAPEAPKEHRDHRHAALMLLLERSDKSLISQCLKEAGITGDHRVQRFKEFFEKNKECCEDPQRNSSPVIYTQEVLDHAIDLVYCGEVVASQKKLMEYLKSEGRIKDTPVSPAYFMGLFYERAHERGMHAHSGPLKLAVYQDEKDYHMRVVYCRTLIDWLKHSGNLADILFGDETKVLQHPHPGGEVKATTGWCILGELSTCPGPTRFALQGKCRYQGLKPYSCYACSGGCQVDGECCKHCRVTLRYSVQAV
jgi:hypothetical protein